MFKRLVAFMMFAAFVFIAVPGFASESVSVEAAEYSFDDRILYGGTAVDIGNATCYSENGYIFFRSVIGENLIIAEADAKYLNYYGNRLWFVADNSIMNCNIDGSDMQTVLDFGTEPVSCLYVTENGLLYLRGETVCSYKNGCETELFTRSGIKGFVPREDGLFRWVTENPDYEYVEENGDEVWSESGSEYISYLAAPNTDSGSDSLLELSAYGNATSVISSSNSYTGPYVKVGEVTLPLSEHMPGTFFSKNGKACTCHHTSSTYCIESLGNCNCMRYYPTGNKSTCEVDLLGAQCFAFSRMVFYKCFGFIDHSMNESLYYSVGSLSRGAVTANSVKELLMKAAPGAHVRLAAGHSVSILTMDEDFIVIYHGNAGGDGVVSQPCVVSTRRYTWEQFANAAAAGIRYVNMPYNYPNSSEILTEKSVGYYKLKANLNLRGATNTQSASLTVIPNGTIIEIVEVDGYWGKTSYAGQTGWVFLEYATYYSQLAISPSGTTFSLGSDGYLRAAAWGLDFELFTEHFDKLNITVTSPDGTDLSVGGYVSTGSVVKLVVDGETIDDAVVCLAGDLNGNGLIDVGDYLIARRAAMDTYELSDVQKAAADVSGDGNVTATDYILIRRFFYENESALFSAFGE